jgi:sulfatase maturation enzyme AslB (radical SAM superfamily)
MLKKAEVQQVLRDSAAIGLDTISFCGGEPFMHKNFVELAQEAIALDLKVQMVTHGGFLTPERAEALVGIDCMTVSVDGPPDAHQTIRRAPESWGQAVAALNMAADVGITHGTNTVIQRDNATRLWESFEMLMEATDGRLDYVRHAPVEVLPDSAQLQIADELVPVVQEQLERIAAECEKRDIFFVHRTQLLEHLPRFVDKWSRHRPLGGCRIPQKFIGYSKLGFYLCWHQGNAIRAASLVEALESTEADAVVAEALAGECVGCNALTYSWDEEWNEGILAGKLFADGILPDQVTTINEGDQAHRHASRARLNILR